MIKRLLQSVRDYKKDTILTPLYLLGEVALEVMIPLIMAELIDKGIEGGSMSMIWKYGLVLVFFALISLLFGASGSSLSQGQCQLIANARAAIADPPVMILDEATSSIDTRNPKFRGDYGA